jgi:hypothetical protein
MATREENNTEELHDENEQVVEDENLDEAETHDMENAENQSVKASKKAEDSTKLAPARKGDKRNSDPMPKSKAGKVSAMYDKMSEMTNEDLEGLFAKFMGDKLAEDSVDTKTEVEVEADFSEDLDALINQEATLSEDFKSNAGVIFEAALKSQVKQNVARLESSYEEKLEESTQELREDLVNKVDSYLNHVVETWMEENQLAIETGLRTEISESFMNDLRDLFEASYIDVPESKEDLVDGLAEQVEDLEERLNGSTGKLLKVSEELETLKRTAIVAEVAEGLADTQAEKLLSLVEDVDYEDEESFKAKVVTIKESYFDKKGDKPKGITEVTNSEDDSEEVEVDSRMDKYLQAIRKTNKS